ncbi:MAG: hypothetical protein RLZZ592_2355 [Pseudomonadota bacterium]|jgi:diguanylate cyclase (GGDEF)-like protein
MKPHPSPDRWPAWLSGPAGRWLLGPLADESPELRRALLQTLREVPVLQLFELFWTVMIAWLAWRATHGTALWPLAWLLLEAVCLPLRLGWPRLSLLCQVAVNVVRLLGMGLGAMASIQVGNLALTVLSPLLVVGLLAQVVSRWVALPRLAIALVHLVGAALLAGLWHSPLPGLREVSPMVMAGALAFQMLALHNHRMLLSVLRLQFENRRLSLQDPLTGLPNRREFGERLERLEQLGRAGALPFALLCMDLDGFKRVNDEFGHEAGDRLLAETARRFRALLRSDDTVCRIGGDEFVVLLPGADPATAAAVAERLLQAVREPFDVGGGQLARVGLSVGIALCPRHGCEGAPLMRQADEALYCAKRAGKGCLRWACEVAETQEVVSVT